MPQDAPRNDVDPYDGLLDFDTEAPNRAFDTAAPNPAFDRKEPDVTFSSNEADAQALPLHPQAAQHFVWYPAVPVVRSNARRNIGIALLVFGVIAILAWSGRLLMGIRRSTGASEAPIQNATQPPPVVAPEPPTNAIPPAPDPQPPATDVPATTATPAVPAPAIAKPSEPATAIAKPSAPATAIATPSRAPVANAAGGLFAITRPVGAQVFVDNKLIGTTPLFMSQLSPGSHDVRLELSGFSTYSSSIRVEPNTRFRLAVQLEEAR
jgi:hypothetical protein